MKGLLVSAVILACFLISVSSVSAAGCVNDNQIIMKLSSSDNAHGALWNQSYGIKLCYDDFWGKYDEGLNPHECVSGDILLKLNTATNSHAASKSSASYAFPVCHRGLGDCTISQGQDCTNNKKAIVYLSSLSNAHLSKTYSDGFYAVCCSNTTGEIIPPLGPANCIDYSDEQSCTTDESAAAQIGCPIGKNCFCEWNANESECMQSYVSSTQGCDYYKCVLTPINYEEAVCKEDGYKSVSLSAEIKSECIGVVDSDCVNKTAEIPCGLVISLDLPFFGAWQFALSIIGILFVYLILLRKRF